MPMTGQQWGELVDSSVLSISITNHFFRSQVKKQAWYRVSFCLKALVMVKALEGHPVAVSWSVLLALLRQRIQFYPSYAVKCLWYGPMIFCAYRVILPSKRFGRKYCLAIFLDLIVWPFLQNWAPSSVRFPINTDRTSAGWELENWGSLWLDEKASRCEQIKSSVWRKMTYSADAHHAFNPRQYEGSLIMRTKTCWWRNATLFDFKLLRVFMMQYVTFCVVKYLPSGYSILDILWWLM